MKSRHIIFTAVVLAGLAATSVASATARPFPLSKSPIAVVEQWRQAQQAANAPDLIERFVQRQPAASFYTPQALRADALRMQAMANAYERTAGANASDGSGLRDGLIGAAGGAALALGALGLGLVVLRVRRPQVAL